jgi:hypothetical protein
MVATGDVVKLVAKETVALPGEKVQQKTGRGERRYKPGKSIRIGCANGVGLPKPAWLVSTSCASTGISSSVMEISQFARVSNGERPSRRVEAHEIEYLGAIALPERQFTQLIHAPGITNSKARKFAWARC